MPRKALPARLYQRPDTKEWIIRDRGKDTRTGFSGNNGELAAEEALARYLALKTQIPTSPQSPEVVGLSSILTHYLKTLRDDIADPARQAYAVKALIPFWRDKTAGDVSEEACKAYVRTRKASSTARRELSVLRAALNKAHRDRILMAAPAVWLPPKGQPKEDWLTRDEFAKILWQLRRNIKTRHAAKLALCQFYTGSRPRTIARTTWKKRTDGPWVDLDQNIWWRAGSDENETVKKRRPHPIPNRLRLHLLLWKKNAPSQEYVVEHTRHPGKPVLDIGKALETACKKAGVRRITPHTLKHTAITLAIQDELTVELASEYFSTSIETIQRTYWHHSPEHQRKAASLMDNIGRKSKAG